jgi:hypothetical protein
MVGLDAYARHVMNLPNNSQFMKETSKQKRARLRELDRRIAEQCPPVSEGMPWWGWVIIVVLLLIFISGIKSM